MRLMQDCNQQANYNKTFTWSGSGATHTAAAVTQRGESAAAAGGARVTQRGVSQRYLSYAQSGSLVYGRSGAARNKTRVVVVYENVLGVCVPYVKLLLLEKRCMCDPY
ncbi:hypothetical protein J6590_038776 [Homalodisca vitripennis]|nr:hypothetical protein J6590_038776 [Homalodisca vitripennis]